METKRRLVAVAASIITPLAIQVVISVAVRSLRFSVLSPAAGSLVAVAVLALTLITGFAFLVRAFRLYAILIGLVYFPAVAWLMLYFGVYFNGYVFGDAL